MPRSRASRSEGEESLARLDKVFIRVGTIETPVQGEEVYAVIRRRPALKLDQGTVQKLTA